MLSGTAAVRTLLCQPLPLLSGPYFAAVCCYRPAAAAAAVAVTVIVRPCVFTVTVRAPSDRRPPPLYPSPPPPFGSSPGCPSPSVVLIPHRRPSHYRTGSVTVLGNRVRRRAAAVFAAAAAPLAAARWLLPFCRFAGHCYFAGAAAVHLPAVVAGPRCCAVCRRTDPYMSVVAVRRCVTGAVVASCAPSSATPLPITGHIAVPYTVGTGSLSSTTGVPGRQFGTAVRVTAGTAVRRCAHRPPLLLSPSGHRRRRRTGAAVLSPSGAVLCYWAHHTTVVTSRPAAAAAAAAAAPSRFVLCRQLHQALLLLPPPAAVLLLLVVRSRPGRQVQTVQATSPTDWTTCHQGLAGSDRLTIPSGRTGPTVRSCTAPTVTVRHHHRHPDRAISGSHRPPASKLRPPLQTVAAPAAVRCCSCHRRCCTPPFAAGCCCAGCCLQRFAPGCCWQRCCCRFAVLPFCRAIAGCAAAVLDCSNYSF